ncbi:ParB/RepB/Spo0J family partition protein [Azospirillum sp. HJ39]|uniref:ParB/RepB/Spo0J family partition protein n=1 Tax=Azospirillum sp. HJ39 TaxID=3159496 RepID=UPI003556D2BF
MSRKLARRADLTAPAPAGQPQAIRNAVFGVSEDFPPVIEVDIDRIDRHAHQPRAAQDDASLEELRRSVERHGLMYPILVTRSGEDGYALVGGGRRLRVFELLGRSTIFARILGGDPDELALVDNLQRKALNAVETARSLDGLRAKHGYTQDKLAEVVGKTPAAISRALGILALPSDVLDEYLTLTDRVPPTTLEEVAAAHDEAGRRKLWALARKGATARAVAETRQALKRRDPGGQDPGGIVLKRRAAGAAVRGMIQALGKLEENREGIGAAERAALDALRQRIAGLLGD